MTAPIDNLADDRRRSWEDRLAGPMFYLAGLFLVVLAGLIHRYPHLEPTDLEAYLILGGLALLWLVALIDSFYQIVHSLGHSLRDRSGHPCPFL